MTETVTEVLDAMLELRYGQQKEGRRFLSIADLTGLKIEHKDTYATLLAEREELIKALGVAEKRLEPVLKILSKGDQDLEVYRNTMFSHLFTAQTFVVAALNKDDQTGVL